MSFTTDAVISCSSGRTLTLINAFFPEGEGFVSCNSSELPRGWYGGTKLLGDGFAVGCFNYLQLDELKTHILSLTGLGGEYVHLLTHREDQTTFQVWHHEFRPS